MTKQFNFATMMSDESLDMTAEENEMAERGKKPVDHSFFDDFFGPVGAPLCEHEGSTENRLCPECEIAQLERMQVQAEKRRRRFEAYEDREDFEAELG